MQTVDIQAIIAASDARYAAAKADVAAAAAKVRAFRSAIRTLERACCAGDAKGLYDALDRSLADLDHARAVLADWDAC